MTFLDALVATLPEELGEFLRRECFLLETLDIWEL